MNEKDRLSLGMGIVFLIAFVGFGYIVIREKVNNSFLPKADKNIKNYINKKYSDEKDSLKIGTTHYEVECGCYKNKVTNKDNDNLYFTVVYKKKKVTDTYNKDYKTGTTLIKSIENKITNELRKVNKDSDGKTDKTLKATISKKLSEFNPSIQEEIIKAKNPKNLSIYNIEKELIIKSWTFSSVIKEIITFNSTLKEQGFTPNTYTFYVTNPNNPGESFKINNLNVSYINENTLNEIVPAIKQNNKEILKKYNI